MNNRAPDLLREEITRHLAVGAKAVLTSALAHARLERALTEIVAAVGHPGRFVRRSYNRLRTAVLEMIQDAVCGLAPSETLLGEEPG